MTDQSTSSSGLQQRIGYPEEGDCNSLVTLVTTHQTTRRLQYEISSSRKHETTIAVHIVVH